MVSSKVSPAVVASVLGCLPDVARAGLAVRQAFIAPGVVQLTAKATGPTPQRAIEVSHLAACLGTIDIHTA
eukprot:1065443-Pyramimonas_sp.AAC.1